MTFNTGNPIGSTDARDLSDNAENFDKALGTLDATWTDRLGVTRDSFEGRLAKGSFYRVGDFATGYTLTNMRQTLEYNGHEYGWAGTFPKVVAPGATPATTGGVGAGAWVDRSDATLRSDLNIVVKVFESVADMKADASLVVGQKCRTIGYYAVGDGGGNDYEIVAAATGTDDGGSYIDLPGSGLQAKGLFLNLSVNLQQYGADGINDDIAINNALSAGHKHVISTRNIVTSGPIVPSFSGQSFTSDFCIENTAENSNSNGVVRLGTFGRTQMHTSTYYGVGAASIGGSTITTLNASDAGNFKAGDIAFIKGGSFYTTGGEDVYEFGQVVKIKSSNQITGDIVIVDSFDDNVPGASLISNITQYAVDSFNLEVLSVLCSNQSPAKVVQEGGGAYKCYIRINDSATCDSFALHNADYGCHYYASSVFFDRIVYELGVNSRLNDVNIHYAKILTSGVVGKRPVRGSEQSQNNSITIKTLDLFDYTALDIPIYIESSKNIYTINNIVATNATLYVGQFASQAFTPTPPLTHGNKFYIDKIYCGTVTAYWRWIGSNLSSNSLIGIDGKSDLVGSVSSGRAIDISGYKSSVESIICKNGMLYVQASASNESISGSYFPLGINSYTRATKSKRYIGNKFGLSDDATDQNESIYTTDITSTNPGSSVISKSFIPGSLIVGDKISFELAGQVSGTSGTKDLSIDIGGVTVLTMSYIPSDAGNFFIRGVVNFSSLTSIVYGFDISYAGKSSVVSGGASIPGISTNATSLKLTAWKGNANDTFRIRSYSHETIKVGM